MNRLKDTWNREPVATAAAIAAALGLLLSLVGVEVSDSGLERWSTALVGVISGAVYVISSLLARRKVTPVQDENGVWVARTPVVPDWEKLTPGETNHLLRAFFRRDPNAPITPDYLKFLAKAKLILDKLYAELPNASDRE